MKVKEIKAIDVHAHFGSYVREKKPLISEFMTGDIDTVLLRAEKANTEITIVSSSRAFFPRLKGDPIDGNKETCKIVQDKDGLLQWVVIDPLKPETYEQAKQMLAHPKCVGIKIHPEEHGYHITDHAEEIFNFAAERNSIILTHSGEQNSLPEDFIEFTDKFPEVTLVLAHHGCGWDNDPSHQVRAIQRSKKGNVFTDTSSASNVNSKQIEWGVKEIGAERFLYGTDSPLYFAPMQRARIDNAEINDIEKKLILRENALKLFKL